jgi:DNA-binding IclR family transcriptional regulator
LAHQSEDLRRYALEEWACETQRKEPAELDSHLAKIRCCGHEMCTSYQVKSVVNISFPVFGARGEAIAGLTVPNVKRLEDNIGVPDVVRALRMASRELSEALGANPVARRGESAKAATAR